MYLDSECRDCKGAGVLCIAERRDCHQCDGLGTTKTLGGGHQRELCEGCKGRGEEVVSKEVRCETCKGPGAQSTVDPETIGRVEVDLVQRLPRAKQKAAPRDGADVRTIADEVGASVDRMGCGTKCESGDARDVVQATDMVQAIDVDAKVDHRARGAGDEQSHAARGSYLGYIQGMFSRVRGLDLQRASAPARGKCSECDGSGATLASQQIVCHICEGLGSRAQAGAPFPIVCWVCKGSGKETKSEEVCCQACSGTGCKPQTGASEESGSADSPPALTAETNTDGNSAVVISAGDRDAGGRPLQQVDDSGGANTVGSTAKAGDTEGQAVGMLGQLKDMISRGFGPPAASNTSTSSNGNCSQCDGNGVILISESRTCQKCDGSGRQKNGPFDIVVLHAEGWERKP